MPDISALHNKHSGSCAIIANGPSLVRTSLKEVQPRPEGIDDHEGMPPLFPLAEKRRDLLALPLWSIPIPTFTMNRSWMAVWPTIGHVVVEEIHQRLHPGVYRKLAHENMLFTAGGAWPSEAFPFSGYNVKINSSKPWSTLLPKDGVVVSLGICGTVTLAAMQVAAYLGFTKLFMVGLDLGGGKKFTGHSVGKLEAQRGLFRTAAPAIKEAGVEVFVVGEGSMCDAFPKIKWPWALDFAPPVA